MILRALGLAVPLVLVAACASATSPQSVPSSSEPAAPAVTTAPQSTIRYGALGDSITFGIGTTNPDTKNYAVLDGIPARGRPGSCLAIQKRCVWQPFVDTFVGDIQVLRRYAPVHKVVVEIGLNDIITSDGATVAQMERAYRKVRTMGRNHGVTVILATLTPFGHTKDGRLATAVTPIRERRRIAINRWIRAHGPYLDFARALSSGSTLPAAYDARDGVHPNNAGQRVLAGLLRTYMRNHP